MEKFEKRKTLNDNDKVQKQNPISFMLEEFEKSY